MIRVDDIHMTFGRGTPLETKALRGMSLELSLGEFVTVIGSNGAGKSTLLNVIAGDMTPTRGTIRFDDDDVTRQPSFKRAAHVARVFQDPMAGTCEALTVEENLSLAAGRGKNGTLRLAVHSGLTEEFRDRLKELGLGLEDRLKDRMGLMSGGQRQSISLLMATLRPSKLLLLDEHTAALDPRTGEAVLRLTDHIVRDQGLTALMVTHSMRHALDVGTRTIMLHEGKIVFDIAGDERKGLDVPDLLNLFAEVRGEALDDDKLLLG